MSTKLIARVAVLALCFCEAIKGQIRLEKSSMSIEMPDLPQTVSPNNGKNRIWKEKLPETVENEDDNDILEDEDFPEKVGRENNEIPVLEEGVGYFQNDLTEEEELEESELFQKLQSNSTKYPQDSDATHLDSEGDIFNDEFTKNKTQNFDDKVDTLIAQLVEAIGEEKLDPVDENAISEEMMGDNERSADEILQNHEDDDSMIAEETSHTVTLTKTENQNIDPIDYIQIREIRNLERKVDSLLEEIGLVENFQDVNLPVTGNEGQIEEGDRSYHNINKQPKLLSKVEKNTEPPRLDSSIENDLNKKNTTEVEATIDDLVPSLLEILNNFDDDEEENRQSARSIEDLPRNEIKVNIEKSTKAKKTVDVNTEKSGDQESLSQPFTENGLISLNSDETNIENVADERNLVLNSVPEELLEEEIENLINQKMAKTQEAVSNDTDDLDSSNSNNPDSDKLENMEGINLYGETTDSNMANEIEQQEAHDEVKNQMLDPFTFGNNLPETNEMQDGKATDEPLESDELEEDYDVYSEDSLDFGEKKSRNIPDMQPRFHFNETNDIDDNNFFDVESPAADRFQLDQAINEMLEETNSDSSWFNANDLERLAGFNFFDEENLFGDNDDENNEIFSSYAPKQLKFANVIDETINKDVFETSVNKNNDTYNNINTSLTLDADIEDLTKSDVDNLSSVDDFLLNVFEPFDVDSVSENLEPKQQIKNNGTDTLSDIQQSHDENEEINVLNDLDPFLSAFPNLRTFEELHRFYNDFTSNGNVQQVVISDNTDINNNHHVLEESNINPFRREDHIMHRQNVEPSPVPHKNIFTDSDRNSLNENVETDFKHSMTDYKENNPHNEQREDDSQRFRFLFFPPNLPNAEEFYGLVDPDNTKPTNHKTEEEKVTNDDSNSDTDYSLYGYLLNQRSQESNNFLHIPSRMQGNEMHNRFPEVKDTENKDNNHAFVDNFVNSRRNLSPGFYSSHREHNKWWRWFWSYLSDFEFSRTPYHLNYGSDFSSFFDTNPSHNSVSEIDNLPLFPNEKAEEESDMKNSVVHVEELHTRNITEEESNDTLSESITIGNYLATTQTKSKSSGSKFFANILSDMKENLPKHSPQKQLNENSHAYVNRTSSHYYVYDFLLAASIALGLLFCIALWLLLVNARRAKKLIDQKKAFSKVPFEDCCDHITHKKQPLPEKGSKNAYFIAV